MSRDQAVDKAWHIFNESNGLRTAKEPCVLSFVKFSPANSGIWSSDTWAVSFKRAHVDEDAAIYIDDRTEQQVYINWTNSEPVYCRTGSHELQCPSCGTTIVVSFDFQWGLAVNLLAPAELLSKYHGYSLGDKIEWLQNGDGAILAWKIMSEYVANFGDPDLSRLLVLAFSVHNRMYGCETCGYADLNVGLIIDSNVIENIFLYSNGQYSDGIFHYALNGNQPEPLEIGFTPSLL